MKVIIHQPRMEAYEYELDDVAPGATDRAILAAAKNASPSQVSLVNDGPAFVHLRETSDPLYDAARAITAARAAVARAMEAAGEAAAEAFDSGASEREVATALGVDRNTVRAWRGKPRSA